MFAFEAVLVRDVFDVFGDVGEEDSLHCFGDW